VPWPTRKILLTIEDIHRPQACGGSVGSRQAAGRARQSRQVHGSLPPPATICASRCQRSACCMKSCRSRSRRNHVEAGGQTRRYREHDVEHARHAPRHQPARGRDRPPRDGPIYRYMPVIEQLRTQFILYSGGASPRLVPSSLSVRSDPQPARADDPQPALQCGEIHQ